MRYLKGSYLNTSTTPALTGAAGRWKLADQFDAARQGTWPLLGVTATGGTQTSGNGYNQWSFTSSGNLVVSSGGTVYYAIVGGGGGGGFQSCGAGGGGVVLGQTTLTAGTYPIVIGSGGSAGTSASVFPTNGINSSAFGFTAVGGGAAESNNGVAIMNPATSGSSGGGAITASIGVGIAGQGWNGGSGVNSSNYPRGGGGGAGGIGTSGTGAVSGNGGQGVNVMLPVNNSNTSFSNRFNGSNTYLVTPSSANLGLGSGDFTIECWVYLNNQGGHGSTNNDSIVDFRPSIPGGAYGTLYSSNNGSNINWYANTANQITGSAISNNTWYHLAICRVSGSTRLFINGTQSGSTYTDSTNYLTSPVAIGQFNDGGGGGFLNGYVSNLRIIKGTGLYSSTFTVPTAPLTAVTNTQLLTCQSSTFVDNSSNAFTITVNGSTYTTSINPFNSQYGGGGGGAGTVQGSTAGPGGIGGGGLGGTSSTPAGASGTANTGGGGAGGYNGTGGNGGTGGSGTVIIWSPIAAPAKTPYVQYLAVAGGGGGGYADGGGGGAGGVLQGLAQVSSGTSYTITVGSGGTGSSASFIIGGSGGNTSISGTGVSLTATGGGGGATGSGGPHTGASGGSGGGADNATGSTPGAGTTGQGYAGGYGGFNSGNYTTGGGGGYGMVGYSALNSTTAGNGGDGYTTYIANPSTYSWSNHFNAGDYLSAPNNSAYDLSSTSFTIEFWVYFTSITVEENIVEMFTNGTGPGWTLYKFSPSNNSGTLDIYGGSSLNSAFTPVAGQWYHVAVSRNNSTGNASWFINGTRTATGSFNISGASSLPLYVGKRNNTSAAFPGYISNLRIVKGAYVYDPAATSITVPTAPLTAIANTSLLTCQGATFSDASSNNATITTSGSPYIASQNPFGSSYAGGGGGGVYTGSLGNNGYGGMGGGGMGAYYTTAGVAGSTNTGGGGGGGGNSSGGSGGSGIVILAYPSTYATAASTTGSPTLTTANGYNVYKFTASGSITI
jgi:hypothetical protein